MHNLSFLIFYDLLLVVIACVVSRLTLFFGSLRLMLGVFFCRRFVGNSHPRIFGLRAHCDDARRGSLSVCFFGLYSPMEKTYWNVSTMEIDTCLRIDSLRMLRARSETRNDRRSPCPDTKTNLKHLHTSSTPSSVQMATSSESYASSPTP